MSDHNQTELVITIHRNAHAEEAEVTDAVKPVWQHMDQEAANELFSREGHCLLTVVVAVVFPAEAYLVAVHGHQPVVGNGDAMGVPPHILENLRRPGEFWGRTAPAGLR